MARRGYFRRRTSGGPNLTTLIASLLAQQRAEEDKAIFDAYYNGGEYKGAAVTDARILEYIKSRRDSFTKGEDPLWDEWNNRYMQTDFQIGEQKFGLRYKQGKISAGRMAEFYRGWLKKIPKDSAFWRDVAGRAAQWAHAARGGSGGGGGRGASAKGVVDRAEDRLRDVYRIQSHWEAMNQTILNAYAAATGDRVKRLSDADPGTLSALFDRGAIRGPKGEVITANDWRQMDLDYANAVRREIIIKERVNARLGTKHYGTVELRDQYSRFITDSLLPNNAIDDRAKAEIARNLLEEELAAAEGDPYAQAAAWDKYANTLTGVYNAAAQSGDNDPEVLGQIYNEIVTIQTGKKPQGADEGVNGSDLDGIGEYVSGMRLDAQGLADGTKYYGQSTPGGALGVFPVPPDSFIGDPLSNYQVGLDKRGNVTRPVVYVGKPIEAVGFIDSEGNPIDPATLDKDGDGAPDPELYQALLNQVRTGQAQQVTSGTVLGYTFFTEGGETTYGYYDENGQLRFVDHNPWAEFPTIGGKVVTGVELDADGKPIVLNPMPLDRDPYEPINGIIVPKTQWSPVLVAPGTDTKGMLAQLDKAQYDPTTGLNQFGLSQAATDQMSGYLVSKTTGFNVGPVPARFNEGERNIDIIQDRNLGGPPLLRLKNPAEYREPQIGPSGVTGIRNIDLRQAMPQIKMPTLPKIPTFKPPKIAPPPTPAALSNPNSGRIYEPPPPPPKPPKPAPQEVSGPLNIYGDRML